MTIERAARAAALAALAGLVWVAWAPARGQPRVVVRGEALAGELPRWTSAPRADTLALRLAAPPAPLWRDWLAALRREGTAVTWSGGFPLVAMERVASAEPGGGAAVLVAAPSGARVRLADTLGTIDSATAGAGGASFAVGPLAGALTARVSVQGGATAAARASGGGPPATRFVSVLARAGWEAKFAAAALEARGWRVDARFVVAPGLAVTQGRPWPLDTARHAAVVVLDSLGPAEAEAVAAYVRRGGGLVVSARAAVAMPAVEALAPARRAAKHRATALAFAPNDPRAALTFDRLIPGPRGVVIEREAGDVAVAAARAHAGRVVETGYDDTWRWRFEGGDAAVAAHAAWWSRLVGLAAYQPERGGGRPAAARLGDDAAPVASLVFAAGPAAGAVALAAAPVSRGVAPWLFAVLIAALLLEWALRRVRGVA